MSARAAASLAIFPRPTRAASPTPVSSFRCGPASLHLHGNLQQLRSRPASLILFAAKSENGASTDANREEPEKVDKRAKPFSNTNK